MKTRLIMAFAFLLLLGSCSEGKEELPNPNQGEQQKPNQNEQQNPAISVEDELKQTVETGGKLVLSGDVALDTPVEISKAVTIDLNGKNIKNNASNVFVVQKGGELTINDASNTGVVLGGDGNASSGSAIWAKGGKVTINGGVYRAGNGGGRAASGDNGNGFICAGADDGTNPGGSITINGGIFEYTGSESEGDAPLLSIADNDEGNPSIVVKGGQFKNFNPGNNTAEGEGTNFVPEEYESVLMEGTTDVYEVVVKGFVELTDGTYEIRTPRGLYTFASLIEAGDTFAGKTIKLTTDIDLNNEPWTPIGASIATEDASTVIFSGTLDGQGYGIKNLKIESDEKYVGLFSSATCATFLNLSIVGGDVVGLGNTYDVGALVGLGRGITVINCHNQDCPVTLQEQMSGQAGGLVGYLSRAEINDEKTYSYMIACSNTAKITSPFCPGGITGGGYAVGSTLVACYNMGDVITTKEKEQPACGGGIVASFASRSDADRNSSNFMYACYSRGKVSEGITNGGLIGAIEYGTQNIHYSYSTSYLPLCGKTWGELNRTVGKLSYSDAVDKLNKGIELYNQTATIPCNYRFVDGATPQLVLQ